MPDLPCSSLAWATDVDTLPADRVVERRDGHWVVRSPGNPAHWWGNFLVFDAAPVEGDRVRWEAAFIEAFGDLRHRTFAWDRVDGFVGAAESEFVRAGYELDRNAGLVAAPGEVHPHPRGNGDVAVRALDPAADDALWNAVLEMWVEGNAGQVPDDAFRRWAGSRIDAFRETFLGGERGGWFVALDGGVAVASLGVVVTGPRARYQQVHTVERRRGRGIASRLVFEAADAVRGRYPGVERFVIVADPEYHALGIYESLGFRVAERVAGVFKAPTASASSS